jgi:hypothetical protein
MKQAGKYSNAILFIANFTVTKFIVRRETVECGTRLTRLRRIHQNRHNCVLKTDGGMSTKE